MRVVPGVDIVEVAEVADSVSRFGDRYLRRVHRPTELVGLEAMSPQRRAEHLAGRFAAKEAVVKALRMPSGQGMAWTCIEVVHDPSGAPEVRLHGTARHWAHLSGVGEVTVSISHEAGRAVAMAIAHQQVETAVRHQHDADAHDPAGQAARPEDHDQIHSPIDIQEDMS